MSTRITPELLAPAGSVEMMHTAFDFGADAVYAGQPRYSLRVRNNTFNKIENLQRGIEQAHQRNKAFFLVTNIYPHNLKIKNFIANMEPIIALKPDALIMADPGLIMLIREKWPETEIHLSVQANTTNYAAIKFWQSVGVSRVILSRELSLNEIEEIRQACPDMEIEVFVHGALCMAYSGRCLLSGYFNHRDANQGSCTNSCRWSYSMHNATENAAGDVVQIKGNISNNAERSIYSTQNFLLEEENRPGELMPIEEDEHGTYIMNSKDLRAVEHVERLVKIGVTSLKIEGRTKSPYYVARTCQVYRRTIDDALAGRQFNPRAISELEGLANRGYTDGFYQRHHSEEYQNYMRGFSQSERNILVGEVVGYDSQNKLAEVEVKNALAIGDKLEFVHPNGPSEAILNKLLNHDKQDIVRVPGSGRRVWLPLPANIQLDKPCFITKFL